MKSRHSLSSLGVVRFQINIYTSCDCGFWSWVRFTAFSPPHCWARPRKPTRITTRLELSPSHAPFSTCLPGSHWTVLASQHITELLNSRIPRKGQPTIRSVFSNIPRPKMKRMSPCIVCSSLLISLTFSSGPDDA